MAFKKIKYGAYKKQIVNLKRDIFNLKDKIKYHESKIQRMTEDELPFLEEQLDDFLKRAGN